MLVGFHAAVATYRFGLDPDNHGIPIVSSSLDLLGVLSLILAIVALGLTCGIVDALHEEIDGRGCRDSDGQVHDSLRARAYCADLKTRLDGNKPAAK